MTEKYKNIAVITMCRDDSFFLSRWISYYGKIFGNENLYIILDGKDQKNPKNIKNIHIKKIEHIKMSRIQGDKYRIQKLSELAQNLLKTYDIVIGCDTDEFLIVDPKIDNDLKHYLSKLKIKTSVSGLGLDIGQHLNKETALNLTKPLLSQRNYALLSTRYTKPIVITRPINWGSGFHSIKKHNFHIDKHLYLLHFGSVDLNILEKKAYKRGADWLNHLKRRGNGTINTITKKQTSSETWIQTARILQSIFRPIYSLRKPAMLGVKKVIKIPQRFKKIII